MKPKILSIERISAEYDMSQWTFNEPDYTFNEAGVHFGGSDKNHQNASPSQASISNEKPLMAEVGLP